MPSQEWVRKILTYLFGEEEGNQLPEPSIETSISHQGFSKTVLYIVLSLDSSLRDLSQA